MNKEVAMLLKDACDDNGVECEVRDDYIGRCRNEACYGIVVDNPLVVIESLVEYITVNVGEGENGEAQWNGKILERSGALSMDGMGKQVIIY